MPMDEAAYDAAIDPRFVEYRVSRDRSLRNALVEDHRHIALRIARRYANRGEPLDDVVQVAMVGLLKSVERFDPSRGLAFAAFATPTISGEIKRYFRDHTWVVRVPRAMKESRLTVRDATERLHQRLGRVPTVAELAQEIGVPEDQVIEAMDAAAAYRPTSLSEPQRRSDGTTLMIENTLGSDTTDATSDQIALRMFLDELPERERTIMELRFFADLTQNEIADKLGISQMHVSRLLRRTLRALKAYLEE